MIQRIQTVFLALVAIAMTCMLFLPIWEKTGANGYALLDAYKLQLSQTGSAQTTQTTAIYIAILAGISALVAGYSIFQYRNRLTQIKLGAINSLLMGAALLGAWYLSSHGEELAGNGPHGDYRSGFYMPVVALLCNLLANRFIKRDEDLVRSADRLR